MKCDICNKTECSKCKYCIGSSNEVYDIEYKLLDNTIVCCYCYRDITNGGIRAWINYIQDNKHILDCDKCKQGII